MRRLLHIAVFCTAGVCLRGAEFQNGQAAKAVIGQPSFSAREAGIIPEALSISNGRLYIADRNKHLLAFELSQIAGGPEHWQSQREPGCTVCGFSPTAVLNQSVIPGISAVSVFGKAVAIADTANHRVLIWRDTSSESAVHGPDIILGSSNQSAGGTTASTLVEPISVALDAHRLFVGDGALHRVLVWNELPATDNQPADVVLGQANFSTSNNADSPAADTISRPAAIESDGQNLFVADSANRRILVFTAADVPLSQSGIVNSASLTAGALAPGALVTIAAPGLVQGAESVPDDGNGPLPQKLAGVEVVFDGNALPLLSVSPTEIRAQLPYYLGERSSGSLYVRAEQEDHTVVFSNAAPVAIAPVAPGLFAFPGREPRPGMGFHAGVPITSTSPAHAGDTITLWAAGLGVVDSADGANASVQAGVPNPQTDSPVRVPVTAAVNGIRAEVVSATLPQGSIGIYEVRVALPQGLSENSSVTLSISSNGQQSNSVSIPVTIPVTTAIQ